MASPPSPHAPRVDLFVGDIGKRRTRFRDLDAPGHAIHRPLVARLGLEDHHPNHTACAVGQRSSLNGVDSYSRGGGRPAATDWGVAQRPLRISERIALRRVSAGRAGDALLPARTNVERRTLTKIPRKLRAAGHDSRTLD